MNDYELPPRVPSSHQGKLELASNLRKMAQFVLTGGKSVKGQPPMGFHRNVSIVPIPSELIPGQIKWRLWKINPHWIVPDDAGKLTVLGQEEMFLREKASRTSPNGTQQFYVDLDPQIIADAKWTKSWIIAIAHPNVPGLVFERFEACLGKDRMRIRKPLFYRVKGRRSKAKVARLLGHA